MRSWSWSWTAVLGLGLWSAAAAAAGVDQQAKVQYEGAQLLRVAATSPAHNDQIRQLEKNQGVERWRDRPSEVDLLVPSGRLATVKDTLTKARLQFNVIVDNVQQAIDSENPLPFQPRAAGGDQKGHNMSWDYYHSFDDINGYLDYLAKTYPKLVTLQTVGRSVEGRPLKVLKISSGEPNAKAIWIDGGTHAREWISPAAVTYVASQLVEHRDKHPDMVKGLDYYIMPVLNPDGYEYSRTRDRMWRKNRSKNNRCWGTDLNRNWGYKWGGKGVSNNPCEEIYGGPRAFSEPETLAVSNYVVANRANIKAFLTFHSYGQFILHPWGYAEEMTPDHQDLEQVGRRMAEALLKEGGRQYTAGNSAALLYPAAGGADDWAKSVGIKYSYTIELPSKSGFILPNSQIVPAAKDALVAVRVMADTARNTP